MKEEAMADRYGNLPLGQAYKLLIAYWAGCGSGNG